MHPLMQSHTLRNVSILAELTWKSDESISQRFVMAVVETPPPRLSRYINKLSAAACRS